MLVLDVKQKWSMVAPNSAVTKENLGLWFYKDQ